MHSAFFGSSMRTPMPVPGIAAAGGISTMPRLQGTDWHVYRRREAGTDAVAAPALAQLQVEPLVAHFFVFYYGVLADITPPVALAAYAASGIAGSNPFKTGNTAFRLGIAKALVPFV